MVACKQMRSPAAVRALKQMVGQEKARKIEQSDPGKLPDSLHGRAMQLIASLQKPVPAKAPPALKTAAWSDKQLWTQLGAWAEQRHTWALHTKMSYNVLSSSGAGDAGMVSPYPEFFESLGRLARQTAKVLTAAGVENVRDVKLVARDLLTCAEAYDWYRQLPEAGLSRRQAKKLDAARLTIMRMRDFLNERCIEGSMFRIQGLPARDSLLRDVRELATRCLKTGRASKKDLETLNEFARSDGQITDRLGSFAKMCDMLASIARKQLAGKPLDERENGLIRHYGPRLAFFHFYEGNSWMSARDDFPIIAPIYVNPIANATLYAALGRPHAIYVMGKLNGEMRLMRGGVLSYREFRSPISKPLDDQSWQEIVKSGRSVPVPPVFTRSFIAAPGEDEVIEMLREGKLYVGIDNVPGRKITKVMLELLMAKDASELSELIGMQHLGARCTSQDAGLLIKTLRESPEKYFSQLVYLVAEIPCDSHVAELMRMLAGPNPDHAHAAAYILSKQPDLIDSSRLTSDYEKLSTAKRGLYCFLLGCLPKTDNAVRGTMLKALGDRDACVRWQGAVALGRNSTKDQATVKALLQRLDDPNTYVAGAALRSLNRLDASLDPRALVEKLRQCCKNCGRTGEVDFAKRAIGVPGHYNFNVLEPDGISDLPDPVALTEALVDALIGLRHKRAIPAIMEIMAGGGLTKDDLGFYALKKLDREGYPGCLVSLALNNKAHIELRVAAMKNIRHCSNPAGVCPRLIPLLADRTPIPSEFENQKEESIGDFAVLLIAELVFRKEHDELPDVFDEYGGYTTPFRKLAEKVRNWSRTATRPADK